MIRPALAFALLASCASNDKPETKPPPPSGPMNVGNTTEARTATGQLVRVTGTLYREKLGDSVEVGDFRVICLDTRFPADRLNGPATVEGVLELQSFEAETGPNGEISQGTEAGVKLWTISGCALK